MEGKTTFLRIIDSLSSKNSNIRYHAQFSLRKVFSSNPTSFFIEFANYYKNQPVLIPRPIAELTFAFNNLKTIEDSYIPYIHSIVSSLETILASQENVVYYDEIITLLQNIFDLRPALLSQFSNQFPILISLCISHLLAAATNIDISCHISEKILPTACSDSPFAKFARARLIAALCIRSPETTEKLKDTLIPQVGSLIDTFVHSPQLSFSSFIPTLVDFFPAEGEKRAEYFHSFTHLCQTNPKMSVYLIPAAVATMSNKEEESMEFVESIVPALSVVPLHFSATLPDDNAVNGFNAAVRAVNSLMTSETSAKITRFFVAAATSGELEKRLGFGYALTCLVKLDAMLDYDQLKKCFRKVSTPLEAGTLAELALALISSGKEVMTWKDMIMFFEDCLEAANEISEQFVLDASALLGNHIDAEETEVLDFISRCVQERFQFSAVHFAVLNAYAEKHEIKVLNLPSILILHLCLYMQINKSAKFFYLHSQEPLLLTPIVYVELLDPIKFCIPARQMLEKFANDKEKLFIVIEFIIQLTKTAPVKEAEENTTKIIDLIGGDLEANIEPISSLYAAFATVDCHLATQHMQNLIQSQSKGWFMFGATVKSSVTIKLVFLTLSKLKVHITPFIQFATEHLPDSTDEEVCAEIIHILANTLQDCNEIKSSFPPKCRLFDFVASSSTLCNDDVFRCIGELLTISPICQVEHIPIVTKLCGDAKEITPNLLFMLKRAVEIAETPGDIQMLLEPFVVTQTDLIVYKLLLAVLEAFAGDTHDSKEFPTLDYNASQKLDTMDSFDNVLSLIARIVGLYIPIFDKAHLAVEFTLRLMARITKKIEVKHQISLQDAVRCISISFNSQSLFEATELMCKNLTVTSVTAFLILFNERESEILHCVQPFIQCIITEQESKASLVFDANETLAKAAAAMLSPQQFPILKLALKTSRYKSQIIDVILEYTSEKYEMIMMILKDDEIHDILDATLPEVQYSKVRATEDFNIDASSWNINQSMKFIELVKATLDDMTYNTQVRFATQFARLTDEEAISQAISVFEPMFKSENPFPFISPFATNIRTIPFIIDTFPEGKIFKGVFTLALSNVNALPVLIPTLPKAFDWILKHQKVVNLLRKQKEISLLRPFLPRLVAVCSSSEYAQKSIIKLIESVTGSTECKIPTTYVGIYELCESITFSQPAADCIIELMKRARGGNNASLLVLCYLAQKQLLERENYKEIQKITLDLFNKDNDEDAQTAALVCASCFPIRMQ